MKTRTLLLLAVACGLAVLGAGVGLMVRLANQHEAAPPHRVGESVRVGDATVVVHSSNVDSGEITIELTIGGVDDRRGGDGFRLVAAGTLVEPGSDGCAAFTVAARRCRLQFRLPPASGSSVSLVLRRAGESVNWQLAG